MLLEQRVLVLTIWQVLPPTMLPMLYLGRAKCFWRVFCELPYSRCQGFQCTLCCPACNVQLIKGMFCLWDVSHKIFIFEGGGNRSTRPLTIFCYWDLYSILLKNGWDCFYFKVVFKSQNCLYKFLRSQLHNQCCRCGRIKNIFKQWPSVKILFIPVLNLLAGCIFPCPPKTLCMPLADGQLGWVQTKY